MASAYQLFHKAERVERLSAEVYGALAIRFRGDPEAHALFVRLQLEEEQHASRVRLFAAHYRNDRRLPVEADAAELDACIAECEQALAEVESGAWGEDLAEVKARLAALEARLAHGHAELMARNAAPALREFLAQLAAMDTEHARILGG